MYTTQRSTYYHPVIVYDVVLFQIQELESDLEAETKAKTDNHRNYKKWELMLTITLANQHSFTRHIYSYYMACQFPNTELTVEWKRPLCYWMRRNPTANDFRIRSVLIFKNYLKAEYNVLLVLVDWLRYICPSTGELPECQGTYSETRQRGSGGRTGDWQVSTEATAGSAGGGWRERFHPAGPDHQTEECLQEEGGLQPLIKLLPLLYPTCRLSLLTLMRTSEDKS